MDFRLQNDLPGSGFAGHVDRKDWGGFPCCAALHLRVRSTWLMRLVPKILAHYRVLKASSSIFSSSCRGGLKSYPGYPLQWSLWKYHISYYMLYEYLCFPGVDCPFLFEHSICLYLSFYPNISSLRSRVARWRCRVLVLLAKAFSWSNGNDAAVISNAD